MLRDRLVCEITDERWQKCLLSEECFTYDSAIKILQALEVAEHEVKDLSTQKPVHRVATRSKPVHSHPKKVSSVPVEKLLLFVIDVEDLTKLQSALRMMSNAIIATRKVT